MYSLRQALLFRYPHAPGSKRSFQGTAYLLPQEPQQSVLVNLPLYGQHGIFKFKAQAFQGRGNRATATAQCSRCWKQAVGNLVGKCVEIMELMNVRLFPFMLFGLHPHQIHDQYVNLLQKSLKEGSKVITVGRADKSQQGESLQGESFIKANRISRKSLQGSLTFQGKHKARDCVDIGCSRMPRYYCDYCDTYLTHDSPSVRKQHNQGYKHKANVRSYYQQFEEQQTQSLIDQKVKEHLHMGGGFMMQPGAYRPPPMMRPLSLPVPGSNPALNMPSMLPPGRPLMPPMGVSTGYMTAPAFRPPAGAGSQGNGLPLPPAGAPTSAPGVRPVTSTSSNGTLPGPPGSYQQQSASIPPPYSYTSVSAPGGYSQQQSSTPSPQVNSAFGSAPPGTMPPGNFQSSQGAPTANSYGTSMVGGYRG
ncbi:hypothetical protein L7F22_051468 [Adiantum nelumboides]|nr:hypothetical protein [Adiantum nelumboides]